MRRQTEEWHPTGIQVAGEKKKRLNPGDDNKSMVCCCVVYICICAWWEQFSHSDWILE